jgi:hypothetical protein
MTEKYSIMDLYHIFFIHLSGDGYLGWIHTLATVNSAAINMGVQVSQLYADLHSLRYIPRSGTAGSWDHMVDFFSFLGVFGFGSTGDSSSLPLES